VRILLPLDNPGGGGIARVGQELARALSRALPLEDQLLVLGDSRGLEQRPNVRVIEPAGAGDGRVRRVLRDQLRVYRAGRLVDLVHMADAKAPILSSKPFILTVHDLFFLDEPEWFPTSVATYKRGLLNLSLRRGPKAIVCVSEHTRERLRVHHPAAFSRCPVVVINPGLEWPVAQPARGVDGGATGGGDSADTGGVGPSDGYFLTVSAIEPRKNHLGLLAAFRGARQAGLKLRWKVVGRPQYAAGEALAALRAGEGVDLVGRVSEPELERLYREARFVATPSFAEGFGYPPLEAMARGVPVVCSTGSALDETVGDAAIRVSPRDEQGWIDALRALEGDGELRARLIAAGLENARRFTWEKSAAAHLELFADVFDGSAASAALPASADLP
jgi:glycosyltransferase involved in cell wall biosynthesis